MSHAAATRPDTTDTLQAAEPDPRPSRARSLLALTLGLLPPYLIAVLARLSQGRGFSLAELMTYPLVVGSAALAAILLIHRYVCGEPLSALNRRRGSLVGDLAVGAALAVAFAVFTAAAMPVLSRLVAPHYNPDGPTLVRGLLENPLLLLIWFGPVLWVGVAAFEEVARVFCMARIMAIWPGAPGRWVAVAASTALFGAMHYYQGPSGIIQTGILGLGCAIVYLRRGRLWPLIIAHALYDAWSLGFALIMISRGMR